MATVWHQWPGLGFLDAEMTDFRRGALLIAAAILAARRIAACEGKSSPALASAIADSITNGKNTRTDSGTRAGL